jgi:hypothetical protein
VLSIINKLSRSFLASSLLGRSPWAGHKVGVLGAVQVLHRELLQGISVAIGITRLRESFGIHVLQVLLELSNLLLFGGRDVVSIYTE